MAKRQDAERLNALLESWARWSEGGGAYVLGGGGKSLLARWMDTKGYIVFGGSAGSASVNDEIEARINDLVTQLFAENELRADVLRLEYSAGWYVVTVRRSLRGYDPRGLDQLQKAYHLGISLRTYERRLAEAREFIKVGLGL
ncbi:hypothetical protein D3C81_318010 [compost metagenome]